jgi:hypothetical protein
MLNKILAFCYELKGAPDLCKEDKFIIDVNTKCGGPHMDFFSFGDPLN